MPARKSRRARHTRNTILRRRARSRRATGKRRYSKKPATTRQIITARPGYGMVRSPFAPNLFTTVSYCETAQLVQSTGGVPGVLKYRANSCYDPRVATGGGQPRYWDTLTGTDGGDGPYNHYRVHAAKIVVTFWPESASAGSANGICAVIPERKDVAEPTTFDELSVRPYCKKISMTTLGSYKPRKIKHFVRMKTILGHKDLSDVDGSAALYNADPSEQVYFYIYSCAIDSTDTLSPRIEVNITYFVQLYNLVDVDDS